MRPLRLIVTERTFVTAQPEQILNLLSDIENISLVDPAIHFSHPPSDSDLPERGAHAKDMPTTGMIDASWSFLGLKIGAPIEYRRGNSGIRLSSSARRMGVGLEAAIWIKPFAHTWSDVLYAKRIECPIWALPFFPLITQSIRRTIHESLRQLERNADRLLREEPRGSEAAIAGELSEGRSAAA